MEAPPTPTPATNLEGSQFGDGLVLVKIRGDAYLPTYMEARLPKLTDWIMHPTMVTKPLKIKLVRRPHLSAIQEAIKHPRKHPAWRVDAIFADRSARATSLSPVRPYLLEPHRSAFRTVSRGG